ncbi:MAG: hypothetical protein GY835_20930 [bacterium]|nr:hypothetical protein [bacterium]
MRTYILLSILLLIAATSSLASTLDHPFAQSFNTASPGSGLGLIEWGRTSISYSSSWMGKHNYSQGLLLKGMQMNLAPGLDFEASFGLSFVPTHSFDNGQGSGEFVLPYAAIHWQPNDKFSVHLEYSHMGRNSGLGLYQSRMNSLYGVQRFPTSLRD